MLVACSTRTFQGTFSAQEEVPPITFREIFFGQESTCVNGILVKKKELNPHQLVATDCLKADISSLHQVKQVKQVNEKKVVDGGRRGADHPANHSHQALSKQ